MRKERQKEREKERKKERKKWLRFFEGSWCARHSIVIYSSTLNLDIFDDTVDGGSSINLKRTREPSRPLDTEEREIHPVLATGRPKFLSRRLANQPTARLVNQLSGMRSERAARSLRLA